MNVSAILRALRVHSRAEAVAVLARVASRRHLGGHKDGSGTQLRLIARGSAPGEEMRRSVAPTRTRAVDISPAIARSE